MFDGLGSKRMGCMTDHKTKLLKMVMEELDNAPLDPECQAQAAIYAVADWFDELLLIMGVTPSSIPCLLRWQANQHDYLAEDSEDDDWQETGDGV